MPYARAILGLQVAGDLGDLTYYTTRRGKVVAYPISPPKELPSAAQLLCRARFKAAQAAWSALTAEDKADWESASLKGSCPATGQNLYMSAAMTESGWVAALSRQTGVPLTEPDHVP
jgi:hypothetical protein